jgi:hypothetical protein
MRPMPMTVGDRDPGRLLAHLIATPVAADDQAVQHLDSAALLKL